MMSQTPDIQINTVGTIETGQYAGWYVLVIPKQNPGFADSYTVYTCTDTTFAFDPAVRQCYDEWVVNEPSLEGVFEDKYPDVRWDGSLPLPEFAAPSPQTSNLVERFRANLERSGSDEETTTP